MKRLRRPSVAFTKGNFNMTYKIVRSYQNSYRRRVIECGLTLEEAQAHCKDSEASSNTCTSSAKKAITRRNGPWFDGYDEE